MKSAARTVRQEHGLTSPKVTLTDMRRIYRHYQIKVDYWKGRLKTVRGQYTDGPDGPVVMVSHSLPTEQRIFTLAHELKHHLFDRTGNPREVDDQCSEIGAEVFAVELIFPDADYREHMAKLGIELGGCSAEGIVRLKRTSVTTLSYTSLAKRATFLEYAPEGSLDGVKWKLLEESMYGEPVYKRIQRYRKARFGSS